MSNEPEQFDAIHTFVCASVAACFATIYPRANPEKFRKLVARVDRPEAPARAPETATQYLAREQALVAEAERIRTYLKDCCCPCCDARRRLRTLSYDRACHSPAAVHCASTDRRDHHPDADAESEARYRDDPSEETIFPALDRLEEDTDAGPAGTD